MRTLLYACEDLEREICPTIIVCAVFLVVDSEMEWKTQVSTVRNGFR